MKDLIERLEKCTGPDRESDYAIYEGLGGKRPTDGGLYWTGPTGLNQHYESLIPRYTSSIDAALTLVPEGGWWMIEKFGYAYSYKYQVDVYGTADEETMGVCAFHQTAPLALCIAALKTRAAKRDLTKEASNG